jgi:hypothetical protein
VSDFLLSVMHWTVQKGTHATKHLPDDWVNVCTKAFFCYHNIIQQHDITDQVGITLLLGNNTTYNVIGQKQIDIVAQDEKCAYSLCVASTPNGNLLPFQQVWSGKTVQLLPQADVCKSAEAEGFVFSAAQSKKRTSHFSTLESMKDVSSDMAF